MSATLSVVSNFSLPTQGRTLTGKQGAAADAFSEAFDITVDGPALSKVGSLATATVATVYSSASEQPATFDYLYFWSDQDCYIQIISAATNVIFKIVAEVPFWLPGFGSLLAAANTTAITGGSTPSVAAVATVVIGNYSGSTMNYQFAVID